ncbi:MAG: transcription-repair coupling factor, partial [Actinomycetota bacterium]
MTLRGLWPLLAGIPGVEAVAAATRTSSAHVTAVPSARPVIASAAAGTAQGVLLVVTSGAREAEDLAWSIEDLLGPGAAIDFPSWETLPHERLSPSADTVGRRLAVLRRLANAEDDPLRVVVASVRAVLQPLVGSLGRLDPLRVLEGETLELESFVRDLAARGFERTDLVERRGQFAVRGGIIDVFPAGAEHPVRIELWGDTVEEIRSFAVADQRSLAHVPDGVDILGVREVPLTEGVRARARELAALHPTLGDVLTRIADGVAVEGMEALAPVLVDQMELLVDSLPRGSIVLVCDPERVRTRAEDLQRTSQEFLEASWHNAAAGQAAPLDLEPLDLSAAAYRSLDEVVGAARDRGLGWWTTDPFALEDADDIVVEARAVDDYRGDLQRALGDIRGWRGAGTTVVVVAEGHGSAERLAQSLSEEGIAARATDDVPDEPTEVIVGTGR